jgi:hypothetical protein
VIAVSEPVTWLDVLALIAVYTVASLLHKAICRVLAAREVLRELDSETGGEAPPHEYVEVRNSMGLHDPDSLEEMLRRAEHDAGLLEIGAPGRQSHCWLCRRASEGGDD